MSRDFDAVCHKCKKVRHLGQISAAIASFGFGYNDQEGASQAAEWLFWHMEHCDPHGHKNVTVASSHAVFEGYEYVHDELPPQESPT